MKKRAILFGATVSLATSAAGANGRYPAANQISFDPANSQHFALETTFGLLESKDGAKSFAWRCESTLSKVSQQDYTLAVTGAGATVIGRYDGMVVTSDG